MKSRAEQLVAIPTSSSNNWCGYFALANCINFQPKNLRDRAYINLDLHQTNGQDLNAAIHFSSLLHKYNEHIKRLQNPEFQQKENFQKQKLQKLQTQLNQIPEYPADQTQQEDRANLLRQIGNLNSQKTPEDHFREATGFTFEQFRILYALSPLNTNSGGWNQYKATNWNEFLEKIAQYSAIRYSSPDHNPYQFFVGSYLQSRASSDWKRDLDEYIASKNNTTVFRESGPETKNAIIDASGLGNVDSSYIDHNHINFLAKKAGFKAEFCGDGRDQLNDQGNNFQNILYIQNPTSQHWEAVVNNQRITSRQKKKIVRFSEENNSYRTISSYSSNDGSNTELSYTPQSSPPKNTPRPVTISQTIVLPLNQQESTKMDQAIKLLPRYAAGQINWSNINPKKPDGIEQYLGQLGQGISRTLDSANSGKASQVGYSEEQKKPFKDYLEPPIYQGLGCRLEARFDDNSQSYKIHVTEVFADSLAKTFKIETGDILELDRFKTETIKDVLSFLDKVRSLDFPYKDDQIKNRNPNNQPLLIKKNDSARIYIACLETNTIPPKTIHYKEELQDNSTLISKASLTAVETANNSQIRVSHAPKYHSFSHEELNNRLQQRISEENKVRSVF